MSTTTELPRGRDLILAIADQNLYVVDPVSGETTRWAAVPAVSFSGFAAADWSDTRQQLLLKVGAKTSAISAQGAEELLQLQDPPDMWSPWRGLQDVVWSPDGRQLAFQIYTRDRHDTLYHGLYIQDATGSPPKYLASIGDTPSWSPDGKRIAFVFWDNKVVVRAIAPDGAGLTDLVTRPYHLGDYLRGPRWSPNGKELAFSEGSYKTSAITILDTSTGELRRVFSYDTEFPEIELAWSPDGSELVFFSSEGSSCEFNPVNFGPGGMMKCDGYRLHKVRRDGSHLTRLGTQEFRILRKVLWIRTK